MKRSISLIVATIGLSLAGGVGCSGSGAAWEGFRMGKNLAKKDTYLRIWLDGQEAAQNKLKKAYFGHASFKVGDVVGTSPKFRYDFEDPGRFGRITGTNIQIHQEFEGDFSHQPEFTIFPASNDSNLLMKPGTDYDLAAPGENFKVLNFEKQEVPGVTLKPGLEYMMVFSVTAERSETVQILFSTK